MDLILALVLGFVLGFLTAGYVHYRKCRKQGLSRVEALSAMLGITTKTEQ